MRGIEIVRHKKTGGLYVVVKRGARIEATNTPAVIYMGLEIGHGDVPGSWWVRPEVEFNDGRFESVTDDTRESAKARAAEPRFTVPLFCPFCGLRHVDEGEWTTRPHHKHLCGACGGFWRVEPFVFGAPVGADAARQLQATVRGIAAEKEVAALKAERQKTWNVICDDAGLICADVYNLREKRNLTLDELAGRALNFVKSSVEYETGREAAETIDALKAAVALDSYAPGTDLMKVVTDLANERRTVMPGLEVENVGLRARIAALEAAARGWSSEDEIELQRLREECSAKTRAKQNAKPCGSCEWCRDLRGVCGEIQALRIHEMRAAEAVHQQLVKMGRGS